MQISEDSRFYMILAKRFEIHQYAERFGNMPDMFFINIELDGEYCVHLLSSDESIMFFPTREDAEKTIVDVVEDIPIDFIEF